MDAPRSCLLVQVVDILRAQEQTATARRQPRFEVRQSLVGGIRPGGQESGPAGIVEGMDPLRLPREGLGRRHTQGIEPQRDSAIFADSVVNAFGPHARNRQDENVHERPTPFIERSLRRNS